MYAQEFFKSYRSKVTLLQTLFPDNLKPPVVMLDDCSDVWNDNENLVKVIPYCDREQDSEEIRYLDCLARVLQQIHTEFFSQLNTAELGASILPDIGKIKDRLRSGVLNGVYIVYGGNSSDKLHRRLCQMGATVRKTVVTKQLAAAMDIQATTHILAQPSAVPKDVRTYAENNGVHLVNPHWLQQCFYKWEKVDERNYVVEEEITSCVYFVSQ